MLWIRLFVLVRLQSGHQSHSPPGPLGVDPQQSTLSLSKGLEIGPKRALDPHPQVGATLPPKKTNHPRDQKWKSASKWHLPQTFNGTGIGLPINRGGFGGQLIGIYAAVLCQSHRSCLGTKVPYQSIVAVAIHLHRPPGPSRAP